MLEDHNGNPQPPFGNQPHWSMFHAVLADPVIFGPLQAEATRLVATAIAANAARPFISSRQAGAGALDTVGSVWHAQFARHFPGFPNGAARGVFGMALWHHLAGRPDRWCFSGVNRPVWAWAGLHRLLASLRNGAPCWQKSQGAGSQFIHSSLPVPCPFRRGGAWG